MLCPVVLLSSVSHSRFHIVYIGMLHVFLAQLFFGSHIPPELSLALVSLQDCDS